MKTWRLTFVLALAVWISSVIKQNALVAADGLAYGFYSFKCGQGYDVERSVKNLVLHAVAVDDTICPSLIRLHFHDAWVTGNDASLLLDSSADNVAEKDVLPNRGSARGFEAVDKIKAQLEQDCPGLVSCADILALAARDCISLILSGLHVWPAYHVPLGRFDGFVSNGALPPSLLPSPNSDLATLVANFGDHGMSTEEMILLSAAHSAGKAQCISIRHRLYDLEGEALPAGSNGTYPEAYANRLRQQCAFNDSVSKVNLDPVTPNNLDGPQYYKNLEAGLGMFLSDAALVGNIPSLLFVDLLGLNVFNGKFFAAMVKMGRIGVLSSHQGQIRRNCRLINS